MAKILHLALFLGLISAIAGGALSAVNSVTKPIIDANALKAEQSNLEKLYPGAEFAPIDLVDAPETITKAFEVVGEGVVYKCENQGFKNPIVFLIGISNDGTFSGYTVLENGDTSGIGTRVNEAEFSDGFIGESIDKSIDTLSGATISSTAVKEAIEAAVAYHQANE